INVSTYYYILTVTNEVGESPASPEVNASPAAPVAVPAAPTGLTLLAGDGLVRISWNDVPGADSYNLYWGTAAGVTPATGTKIPGISSPFLHEALVDGTTYNYVLAAVNAIGEGAASAESNATPAYPVAPPAAPAGLAALAGNGMVTLSWNPVAGATSYNIYWGTVPGVTVKSGNAITGSLNPKWKQTSRNLTAAQLRAAPEYFNQGAWDIIAGARYPQTMPYSAGLDALRTYLQQFNLPLWQLRQALLPTVGATPAQLLPVAAERFGMSKLYTDITTNPDFIPRNTAWNTGSQDPVNALVPVSPPFANPSQLSFITAANITYEQMLELLQMSWVQGGLGVSVTGVNDLCMTSDESLSPAPLDARFLDRAHRFLKLWVATGYKMIQLDQLIPNALVGAGILDGAALIHIAAFRNLQDRTKLSFDQLLSFFQSLDTTIRRNAEGNIILPFYQQVYQNPSVSAIAPDPDLVAIGSGNPPVDPVLTHHLPAIQAALGISTGDANVLFSLTDDTLTLANLSLMYRVSLLSKQTRLSIPQLLKMALLLNPAAGNFTAAIDGVFAGLASTDAFLSQVVTLQQSGISIDALIYLTTPPASTTLATAIAAADTTVTVTDNSWFPASNFYIQIGAETLLVTAVSGIQNNQWTVTRGQLGTVAAAVGAGALVTATAGWATSVQMTATDIASTLSFVQKAVLTLLSAQTTLVSAITAAQTSFSVAADTGFPVAPFYVSVGAEIMLVTAAGGPGNTNWTVTRGQLGTGPAAAAAGAAVVPAAGDVNGAVISVVAANAHNAAATGVSNDLAAYLLNNLKVPGTGTPLINVLTDNGFINSNAALTSANFPAQFLALQLFDKCALIVRTIKLVVSDLSWLFSHAAVYQGVDFSSLPVTVTQPAQNLNSLLSMILLVKLARLWTSAPPASPVQSLYDIIGGVATGT
ncbi:MAG TPA: hypothetical protein VKQ52_01125, partial [Puia sp.]|nr:hypothetical protein [Puia sp.]